VLRHAIYFGVPLGLLAAAGAVTGCGLSASTPMSALPEIEGRPGARPTIIVPSAEPGENPVIRVLSRGSGRITQPGEVVITDVEIKLWRDNRNYLNSWETQQPTTTIFDGQHVSPLWEKALIGRPAGSRVLLVAPARFGFGPRGMAPSRVDPLDTLIEVFDIIGGYRPNAQVTGEQRPAVSPLPQVTVAAGREPEITLPKTAPPSTLIKHTLIEGDGKAIGPGSVFVTSYVVATWDTGVYDSTYRRGGPNGFRLGPRSVPPGWQQALTGVRAGSRVLVVVPEKMGRGFELTLGGIGAPAGKTLVYVFDILDVR
jgi:FKBP-type peptidyl-prolyl cis-trans isomerase